MTEGGSTDSDVDQVKAVHEQKLVEGHYPSSPWVVHPVFLHRAPALPVTQHRLNISESKS